MFEEILQLLASMSEIFKESDELYLPHKFLTMSIDQIQNRERNFAPREKQLLRSVKLILNDDICERPCDIWSGFV